MPGITKKKTKKAVRSADTGRAKKDSGAVARFARDNSTALKALGWVFATPAMAAKEANKFLKSPARGVARTKSGKGSDAGTSKGMRGSEKKTTKKSRGRK